MKLAAFLRELGQPVAYYPKLAQVTGGILANLFLCQMYYWQGKQDDPDGWIYKTQAEIEAETGLSRREQETARQLLRQRNLIQERYKGLPRRLEFWLDEEELENRWAFFLEHQGEKSLLEDNKQVRKQRSTPKSSQSSQPQPLRQAPKNPIKQDLSIMAQTGTIVCPKPPDNNVQNRQTIMAESAIIDCTKPPDLNAQNPQASVAQLDKQAWRIPAGNIYTEITTENTNRDYNTYPPNPPSGKQPCEGDHLTGQKMCGSLAELPAGPLDQFELLGNKICHDNQFSAAKEKIDGSQLNFSASLPNQSELTEKLNNFGQGFYSAAQLPPSCFEVAEKLPNNSGQGFYSAAESQPVEVEVAAFESYTSFSQQLVVTDTQQPNVGEARGLGELREKTPLMNPGALDQTSGYVLALSPDSSDSSSSSSAPKAPFGQQHSATTRSQNENRYQRTQPHLPKNLDGSDRLPWDTAKRGVFDLEFEKHMARSLMQYPAYRDLMAGELMTKVRKHISAGRYDLKRRDELLIEWEAMQSGHNASDKRTASSTLTAKGAARRAKIARALSMEMP